MRGKGEVQGGTWQRDRAAPVIARAVATLSVASTVLTGCSGGVFDPQGPIAAGNTKILLNSLAVMLVIVIPTLVALLLFAWKYRATNSQPPSAVWQATQSPAAARWRPRSCLAKSPICAWAKGPGRTNHPPIRAVVAARARSVCFVMSAPEDLVA